MRHIGHNCFAARNNNPSRTLSGFTEATSGRANKVNAAQLVSFTAAP